MKKKYCAVVLFFLSQLCFAQRNAFPDVLNLRTEVTDVKKILPSVFSDMGAWYAYALPEKKEHYGAFIGPLLMDMNGRWLANTLAQLKITENGKEIDLSVASPAIHYYPGLLEQQLQVSDLKITLQLIFVSRNEALLQTEIVNTGKQQRKLTVGYSGKTMLSTAKINALPNGIDIHFNDSEHRFIIDYLAGGKSIIKIDNQSYTASFPVVNIAAGKAVQFLQSQQFYHSPADMPVTKNVYQFLQALNKNKWRWDGYLQQYFTKAGQLNNDKKRLAVKSIVTLMTNWRSRSKDILHDGVFPSVNYQGFYGVWSWDSWKQAVALGYFNQQLAKDNIRSMFDYQDEQGMVADCIYTDKKENNWRDTKPPLAAWAVREISRYAKDNSFIKEMYPKLVKYHQWWYQNRDHDKNGLCEYGSTDGTRIAAAWESGMDNAVRFDSAVMMKNNPGAWSLNQESVDLNAYLYAEKLYLAALATSINKIAEAEKWKKEAKELGQLINKRFYNAAKGYYYDKLFNTETAIDAEGPEGWIPLWAGIASKEQAAAVKTIMANETKFNTKIPLPTLTADHPKFNPRKGYWRGPVWLDQFYFGVEGLKQYGYISLAKDLTDKLLLNGEGILTDMPLFENYHPITGEGLNAKNFSWSAAHILMLLKSN